MLRVAFFHCKSEGYYAECQYAECCYPQCHSVDCHGTQMKAEINVCLTSQKNFHFQIYWEESIQNIPGSRTASCNPLFFYLINTYWRRDISSTCRLVERLFYTTKHHIYLVLPLTPSVYWLSSTSLAQIISLSFKETHFYRRQSVKLTKCCSTKLFLHFHCQ